MCPIGYGLQIGRKFKNGSQTQIHSKKAQNMRECGQRCDENIKCLSIEWSESKRMCNLLTATTTDGPPYSDFRFCSKNCPNGYHFQTGDKIGHQIQSDKAQNIQYRGNGCNEDEKCRSTEWSESRKRCNLITAEVTDGPAYEDYLFCTKSCPNGYRFQLGDKLGLESHIHAYGAKNIRECGETCDADKDCRSIEWSDSERNCILLRAYSTDGPKSKDYLFCSKTEGMNLICNCLLI